MALRHSAGAPYCIETIISGAHVGVNSDPAAPADDAGPVRLLYFAAVLQASCVGPSGMIWAMSSGRGVALVTGSTSGIGASIARRLAADGLHVVVHSRISQDTGRELAREFGGTYLQADLADENQARHLVQAALEQYGRIDVLINNAAISWPIPHEDMEAAGPDVWRRIFDVNLIAPWVLATAAMPSLRSSSRPGGGCIVNITSHAGVRPKGSSIPYAASKAALNHVTRLLAVSCGPQVRVNAIAPGLVNTPMTATWQAAQDLWRTKAPLRRAAEPEDVADLTASILANQYLTGEVIVFDGGLNLT